MKRSSRERAWYALAIIFAAAPLAFAVIAALSRRRDYRMLWMAVASLIGTTLVMLIGRTRSRQPVEILVRAALAFILGTVLAAWVARRLGATAAAGIWPVAAVLSFCWAASYAFAANSRPRSD